MAAGDHRILIYDRMGILLEEVEGICDREWLIDKVHTLKLTMTINDPKITDKNFTLGNRILVESDDVKPWSGVLWTPISEGRQSITFSALGGKMYLERRILNWHPPRGDQKLGAMVVWILQQANQVGITPITISDNAQIQANLMTSVADGIVTEGMTALAALDAIAESNGAEWWLVPVTVNNELRWELHFRKNRTEGLGPDLVVGDLDSSVTLPGTGGRGTSGDITTEAVARWGGERGKGSRRYRSEGARGRWGHWEDGGTFSFESEEQANAWGENKLREESYPKVRYKLELNPAIDQSIGRTLVTGRFHNIIAPDVGFFMGERGTREVARLIAFGYSELDGIIDLILESTFNPEYEEWLYSLR